MLTCQFRTSNQQLLTPAGLTACESSNYSLAVMRSKLSHILISLFAFLAPVGWDAYADSEWSNYTYSTNKTINLQENVFLTKPITITDGATVTINNTAGKTLYIRNGKDGDGSQMFIIESGATLNIVGGGENSMIIVDGGAGYTWEDYKRRF